MRANPPYTALHPVCDGQRGERRGERERERERERNERDRKREREII